MKEVVKIKAVFNKDDGLDIRMELVPVVKENEQAIVLDTKDFTTVYKGEKDNDYKDYINAPKRGSFLSVGDLVEVTGYFSNKELAEKIATEDVRAFLVEKYDFFGSMITLLNSKK